MFHLVWKTRIISGRTAIGSTVQESLYQRQSVIYRTDIERALDGFISDEEGMKFQGLAVTLAKQKWPDLIACERHIDLGLDAYAPASLAADRIGKGLACSITLALGKIKDDAKRAKENFDDIKVLIFATPQKVTNLTAQNWADEIRKTFGYELTVMSREDIVTSLMDPGNLSICRTQLGIPVVIEAAVEELGNQVLAATSELTDNWLRHPRLAGRPLIPLQAVKLEYKNGQPDEILSFEDIRALLTGCHRLVLEAPAGRGKTTTLVQLANLIQDVSRQTFLIDLREWAESGQDILEFIARSPEFRAHNITPEDLARLSKVAHFSFLLNGWNEISESNSEKVGIALSRLERSFPTAGIIVATRNHPFSPPLPGAVRVRLLPLNRTQRTDYLRKRLGSRADKLVSEIDDKPVLDELTRTFLILAEVATIFESGRPIPATKVGVLSEVMRLLEQMDEHNSHLQGHPVRGRARDYLEELAVRMTGRGETAISEEEARAIVSSANQRLRDEGQIAMPPEPTDVLRTLCAHHILERHDSQSVTFSFEHQQFQEFYSAGRIDRQLRDLVSNDNHERNRGFAKQYVNEPDWDEPLRMVAEEIGMRSAEAHTGPEVIGAGTLLIECALGVDPVFAAELSRLCGGLVWERVRTSVAGRLRSWYEVDDEHHRQCAVAGMLATGSEEFSDIILPLLASEDQQVRLGTYRAGNGFHLSSLGTNWQNVVKRWSAEARIDFIYEMSRNRWVPSEVVENFALADPSAVVRAEAIEALSWVGSEQGITRLWQSLDEESFEEAVRESYVEMIPPPLRPRALAVCRKMFGESEDAATRLRILLRAAELGDTATAEKLKRELIRFESAGMNDSKGHVIEPALKMVQRTEPEWVSHWVAGRIVDGSLWRERWITFVTVIPNDLKEQLLEKISREELQYNQHSEIIAVLAATGDAALASSVFAKLCAVRRKIADAPGVRNETERAIARQMEDLLRALSPDVVVTGLSEYFANEFDAVEFNAVVGVFSSAGREKTDLKGRLQDDLRQKLRGYLKQGVPRVLDQGDFTGEMKVHLASALSGIGEPGDIEDLRQLIRADINRVRDGMAAHERREENESAKWCANRYDHWHVGAAVSLDADKAEALLLEILPEWEYENYAASALMRLATTRNTENQFWQKTDYGAVWEARAGQPHRSFDEPRRQRYAAAIRQRIAALRIERTNSNKNKVISYNFRLKELARSLATLDGQDSAELVLQVLALPGEWDGHKRCEALEALLFSGAVLPTEASLDVLNPTIEQVCAGGLYNDQKVGVLKRCLCLLPFVAEPSIGIGRIRQVLAETEFPSYELREVVSALGQSRCSEALGLLQEIADTVGSGLQQMFGEWVDAVATLGGPESKRILLSFIDPDAEELRFDTDDDRFGGMGILVSRIADLAREEPGLRQRIFQFCEGRPPQKKRHQLSKVIAKLGTVDAVSTGLNLIDDGDTEQIPFDLWRAIETLFLERRDGQTKYSYTQVGRSSNEIRVKLFEMALNDGGRKKSAFALLGQIEVWRLEYGRPGTEPRHPAFDSGEMWPPAGLTGPAVP